MFLRRVITITAVDSIIFTYRDIWPSAIVNITRFVRFFFALAKRHSIFDIVPFACNLYNVLTITGVRTCVCVCTIGRYARRRSYCFIFYF